MQSVKVLTPLSFKRLADGVEKRSFTGINDESKICIVQLICFGESVEEISPGKFILLTNVSVTQKPDVNIITVGKRSKV